MSGFIGIVDQPFAGITGTPIPIWKHEVSGTDAYLYSASLPNLSFCYDGITNWNGDSLKEARLSGAGVSFSQNEAKLKAVAEAAERYASSVLLDSEVLLEKPASLRGRTIDLQPVIECAEREKNNGFVRPLDDNDVIRWVKGWCLIEKREKYVPAIMTHMFPRPTVNETFWLPISTGVAAHTSVIEATISAICELIERDAIALNWLTKRVLPRIDSTNSRFLAEARRSDTQFHFFDATTDLGIPTVYAIEEHAHDPKVANVVACCTDFDFRAAIDGVIRELHSTRTALKNTTKEAPKSMDQCVELEHGALYLGQRKNAHYFDFLKESRSVAQTKKYYQFATFSNNDKIKYLIEHIGRISNDLLLVDVTTDDLRDLGLHVVRAVAPGLMPMSTNYTYRYLGHPRIDNFARNVLESSIAITGLNEAPQPFA